MIDPTIRVVLTAKELALLVQAAESKISSFYAAVSRIEQETGKQWEGGDIDDWDANDIALLKMTLEGFKKIEDARKEQIRKELNSD